MALFTVTEWHDKLRFLPAKLLRIFALLLWLCPDFTYSCVATASSGAIGGVCCPLLVQTISSNTQFADGVMTFVYDNINCPQTVTTTCSQPQPNLNLNAAIVANTNNFLTVGAGTTTFPGTCVNGQWTMGTPPLVVNTIECLLTNQNQG